MNKIAARITVLGLLVVLATAAGILASCAKQESAPPDAAEAPPSDQVFLGLPTSPSSSGILASESIDLTSSSHSRSLTWLTAMKDAKKNSNVGELAPESLFVFTLALANVSETVQDVKRHRISESLEQELANSAKLNQPIVLQTILLTDPDALGIDENEIANKNMTIDIRRLAGEPAESAEDAVTKALGKVEYRLRSGAKEGWTYVAVVLVKDNRALDQIVAYYCISACEGEAPEGRVPGPYTVARILSTATETDAALFLTELEKNRLHGVLIFAKPRNGKQVWIWSTTRDGMDFLEILKDTVLPEFQTLDTREELLRKGQALTNYVFPAEPDANAARDALREFVAASPVYAGDGQGPYSLFVKFDFLAPGKTEPTFVPMGLLVLTLRQREKDFIGRYETIEQPLEYQRYGSQTVCPANWVAFVPNETTGEEILGIARTALVKNGTDWSDIGTSKVYGSSDGFNDWLLDETEHSSTALIVLSHHNANKLYFVEGETGALSSSVRSKYQSPSIAILNGCGTGKPGAIDFVRRFNRNGFETAIVSNFNVHPAVAGTYLRCFQENSPSSEGKQGFALAYIHFQAVNNCIWERKDSPHVDADESSDLLTPEVYAANALKYLVLGNGNVRVCRMPFSSAERGVIQ